MDFGDVKLVYQGAEARIYRGKFHSRCCVIKERFVKTYRHARLDERLTGQRLRNEVKSLARCRELGIRVPTLYHVNTRQRFVCMEDVQPSVTVRDRLNQLSATATPTRLSSKRAVDDDDSKRTIDDDGSKRAVDDGGSKRTIDDDVSIRAVDDDGNKRAVDDDSSKGAERCPVTNDGDKEVSSNHGPTKEQCDDDCIMRLANNGEQCDEEVNHSRSSAAAAALDQLAVAIGRQIARLHAANIIHGDLTTSNMLLLLPPPGVVAADATSATSGATPTLSDGLELVLIDFGLSSVSALAEVKAVDLYVLERAFLSSHPNSEATFARVLQAYAGAPGLTGPARKAADAVIKKLDEVRQRGRKRLMVG